MRNQEKIDGLKQILKAVRSKEFGKGDYMDGLCLVLWRNKKYSVEFRSYLYTILPRRGFGPFRNYSWEPGAKAPRIKWINEQIKKLEKK